MTPNIININIDHKLISVLLLSVEQKNPGTIKLEAKTDVRDNTADLLMEDKPKYQYHRIDIGS